MDGYEKYKVLDDLLEGKNPEKFDAINFKKDRFLNYLIS
jgi:hypothetical protein